MSEPSRKRFLNSPRLNESPDAGRPQAKRPRIGGGGDDSTGGYFKNLGKAVVHAAHVVWSSIMGTPQKTKAAEAKVEADRRRLREDHAREKDISLLHDSRSSDHEVWGVDGDGEEVTVFRESKGVQTIPDGEQEEEEASQRRADVLASFGGFTSSTKSGINITSKKAKKKGVSGVKKKDLGIVDRIREEKLSARTFSSSPSYGSHNVKSPPSNFKAKHRLGLWPTNTYRQTGTPTQTRAQWRARGKDEAIRAKEMEMYQNILARTENVHIFEVLPTRKTGFNILNQTELSASPFFAREAVTLTRAAISLRIPGSKESRNFRERIKSSSSSTSTSPRKAPEVIDLCDEDSEKSKSQLASAFKTPIARPRPTHPDDDINEALDIYAPLPNVEEHEITSPPGGSGVKSFNSLEAEFKKKAVYSEDFVKDMKARYDRSARERGLQVQREEGKKEFYGERREDIEKSVVDRIQKHLSITEVPLEVSDSEDEEEAIEELPEITDEMEEVINRARNSRGETLVDKFSIAITRKDIETLKGLNWLNDEVVNFYMQLICERSEKTDNWPKVYAFNTFFYPRLMDKGHAALKRWTRKIDLFSFDLILIPVHLGMHWCLATIDLSKKAVYYYDSMLGKNERCLNALLQYLKDEHLDKKKAGYDVSGFEAKCVQDIPQQMNGSDCGMFACKFAEYLSRRAKITFDQQDMPYFRRRMVYEIVSAKLMHP